jgi:hypothetical protein
MSTINIKIIMFLGSKVWQVRRALPPSVSRLSRRCGILNISQPYRPPRLDTGIALLFLLYYDDFRDMDTAQGNNNTRYRMQNPKIKMDTDVL